MASLRPTIVRAVIRTLAGLCGAALALAAPAWAGAPRLEITATGAMGQYGGHDYIWANGRMTGEVAADWGLSDRGTLEVGKAADIVIFDPAAVSVSGEEFVDDFPGEARRYVRRSTGYDAVIVNGVEVYRDGQYTDARPGEIV